MKKMQLFPAALLVLPACSGDVVSDPDKWSCDALIKPVIKMSAERSPKVLEISNTQETLRLYGSSPSIQCRGSAEWSEGTGAIEYGARVSSGDNIILEYRQD